MLSILYNEFEKYGCPNCGCDHAISGGISFRGVTTATCHHCNLEFELRPEDATCEVRYGNEKLPAAKIVHPRTGIEKWHWEPKDERPEPFGEYWRSRGPGYPDISGFVRTKAAGERILQMVKNVLGREDFETWLDYREREPNWIQFKFYNSEFNPYRLEKLTELNGEVITQEIIRKCVAEPGEKEIHIYGYFALEAWKYGIYDENKGWIRIGTWQGTNEQEALEEFYRYWAPKHEEAARRLRKEDYKALFNDRRVKDLRVDLTKREDSIDLLYPEKDSEGN